MRHRDAGVKLSRARGPRTALRRTLVTEFFRQRAADRMSHQFRLGADTDSLNPGNEESPISR